MQIELEITNATQFATAYSEGKPVASVQRKRVYSRGPEWKVFTNDGTLLLETNFSCGVAARIARALARKSPEGL